MSNTEDKLIEEFSKDFTIELSTAYLGLLIRPNHKSKSYTSSLKDWLKQAFQRVREEVVEGMRMQKKKQKFQHEDQFAQTVSECMLAGYNQAVDENNDLINSINTKEE